MFRSKVLSAEQPLRQVIAKDGKQTTAKWVNEVVLSGRNGGDHNGGCQGVCGDVFSKMIRPIGVYEHRPDDCEKRVEARETVGGMIDCKNDSHHRLPESRPFEFRSLHGKWPY